MGTPYLLEAFRLVLKREPKARLNLNRVILGSVAPIIEKNIDLPIDWHPSLPPPQLAELMRASDILVLPSLEDGFARTVTEALSCGLPVITTPNTGASDVIIPGQNGEVVPIRNPAATADAILKWYDRIRSSKEPLKIVFDPASLSFEHFESEFIGHLVQLGLVERKTAS
jgi:glycosyltransferase involved in cell wall biosynthesis